LQDDVVDQPVDHLNRTLHAAGNGDPRAAEELLPLVYDELRRLARARMSRTPPGATIQPTALVHEAYMRLVGDTDPGWNGRGHFFGAAARAMRNILVEHARKKGSLKRGGDRKRVELNDGEFAIETPSEDILALDEALKDLEQADPRKARVVMLHYFAGLTLKETAEAIGVSLPTVEREWRFTRALLHTQLTDDAPDK
jgi:RNA polymerase sigma factor (TIGR02999 family)